jgi:3D-(3,5/4)-trihydroxycyclohexane-1,2-dione acylhydrolase (decyclizing)
VLPVDLAANAASLGATCGARTRSPRFATRSPPRPARRRRVIVVPVDRESRVGGYESWWDVPVAEVSATPEVQGARAAYESRGAKSATFCDQSTRSAGSCASR